MEDKKTHFDLFTMVSLGGYLFLMILFSLSKIAAVIFCSLCGVFFLVYSVFQWIPPTIETLERRMCKRLGKEGYRYEKKEGTLYVFKNNNRFEIQLSESFNKRIKHLFVLYKFKDDNLVKVTTEGWCRAANCINIRNTEIIFVALEDHFCCCYQAAIGNARDFLKEFDLAYQTISEAMEDYGNLFPYLERDYPNQTGNKNSIGYKQDEP